MIVRFLIQFASLSYYLKPYFSVNDHSYALSNDDMIKPLLWF